MGYGTVSYPRVVDEKGVESIVALFMPAQKNLLSELFWYRDQISRLQPYWKHDYKSLCKGKRWVLVWFDVFVGDQKQNPYSFSNFRCKQTYKDWRSFQPLAVEMCQLSNMTQLTTRSFFLHRTLFEHQKCLDGPERLNSSKVQLPENLRKLPNLPDKFLKP